ncbi:hypothetical protein PHLCEN_2v3419 [Hermanssonia centrifuga]|uniref:Uncharacterized protein n=1 Tax=Hermanssonia centrifuga TaxID=98765 RepID=A0A2R6QIV7_9APHY|nr:hypothetical protein PHLCEN_2v3419 [Hermanssonia centrifuga]
MGFAEIEAKKTLNNVNYGDIDTKGKIIVIVAGVLFTIAALISFAGFIGSVVRNRRMVKAYSVFTWIFFLINCAGVGFFLFFAYSGKALFNGCEVKDENGVEHDCTLDLKLWQKIVYTIIALVDLLLLSYIASVIGRYVDQLYEERDYSHEYKIAKESSNSTYQPTYYPPQVQDSHQGLLNPAPGQYPYSDAAHSFGNNASHA